MNDDYLWDRSGQPDPEIQQLEEILGELRYQPRPLEIPADLKPGRKQFPRYAIAAAVGTIVFGAGSWLALQKQDTPGATAAQPQPVVVKTVTTAEPRPVIVAMTRSEVTPVVRRKMARVKSHRSRTTRTPQLSSEELAEAVAAKERLMMALRLASSKLNYAQKKAQGSNPPPAYHQHKIG